MRAFLFLASLVLAPLSSVSADVIGAGYGLDSTRAVPAGAVHATRADRSRVMFDGSLVWLEADDGSFLTLLASIGPATFPSFVALDPGESYALIGESTNGGLYRVPLVPGPAVFLASLAFNYDAAFADASTAFVSAATCGFGCGNQIWTLDTQTGATSLVASVPGPSGPLARSSAGDLYYAVQSDTFPTPPGAVAIVRWSSAQLAGGPFPLGLAQASTFTSGLDGGAALRIDPVAGHLFVAETVYGADSSLTEIDRFGVVVGTVAESVDPMGSVEILGTAGAGGLAVFQPQGRELRYRTTDFNQFTAQVAAVSPRRPVLTTVPGPGDTMTLQVSGARPLSAVFVISGPVGLYSPQETAHDLGNYLFWTGIPFGNIRRAGIQFVTDATGAGQYTFSNPPAIQGTRVLQVLVRDASGTFRGSSNAAFN